MKKVLGLVLVAAGAAVASAQISHSFVELGNTFNQGGNAYYTFRLIANVATGDDWLSSSVDAVIAQDNEKTFYQDAFGGDPINPAFIPVFPTVQWDTYFTSPAFFPNTNNGGSQAFAAGPTNLPKSISAVWFDTANSGGGDWVIAQFTICQPADKDPLTLAPVGNPVATIAGASGSKSFPTPLTPYSFNIYQVPEPTTLSLLALGGLAGLIRRR